MGKVFRQWPVAGIAVANRDQGPNVIAVQFLPKGAGSVLQRALVVSIKMQNSAKGGSWARQFIKRIGPSWLYDHLITPFDPYQKPIEEKIASSFIKIGPGFLRVRIILSGDDP